MRKYKKVLSVLAMVVAMTMVATLFASVPKFSDVPMNHWAYPYIQQAAENEWVAGVGDGKFDPNGKVTGAQFVTMITRAFYEKSIDRNKEFDTWYGAYQEAANKNCLLTEETLFINLNSTMNKPLTRTEMAFILSRVIDNQHMAPTRDKIDEMLKQIPDINTIEERYHYGVGVAYSMGLLSGVDNKGTFNGNDNINRAQAAVVLCRLDEVIKNGGVSEQPSKPVEPEVPETPETPEVPETPSGSGAVGTVSDQPVKLSYETHKPVTDYWSQAPADIQAITDKDAFNAAVQTLKDQDKIRNAPENKGGWSPYYNYAAYIRTGDQKQLNVTKAMTMMSSNSYGFSAKGRLKNADNSNLYVIGASMGNDVVAICREIVDNTSASNDKALAEQLVQAIADRFTYGPGEFTWKSGTFVGQCNSYEGVTGALFAVADIPYIHCGGASALGPHDWGYAYLDGNWYAVDSTAADADGGPDDNSMEYAHMDIDQYLDGLGNTDGLSDACKVAMALVEISKR